MESVNSESLGRLERSMTVQREETLKLEDMVCLIGKKDSSRYSAEVQNVIEINTKARRLSASHENVSKRRSRGHERRPSTPHSIARSLSR